jgi:hypothetical protein
MGQILHGSATTTEAIRRAIQHSQESLRALARRYGVNPKTIAKWKSRKSVSDLRTGPKEPRSTVLSVEEEAVVVAFRRHTLLPLDDCLYKGNVADVVMAIPLLGTVAKPKRLLADEAYDADSLRRWLKQRKIRAAIRSTASEPDTRSIVPP